MDGGRAVVIQTVRKTVDALQSQYLDRVVDVVMHLSRRRKHNKNNIAAATLFNVTVSKQQAHVRPSGTSLCGDTLERE